MLQAFCEREGLSFIETSALEATNVEQVRRMAAKNSLLAGSRIASSSRNWSWHNQAVCSKLPCKLGHAEESCCLHAAAIGQAAVLIMPLICAYRALLLMHSGACPSSVHSACFCPQAFQRILTEIYHIVSKKALASEDGPAAVRLAGWHAGHEHALGHGMCCGWACGRACAGAWQIACVLLLGVQQFCADAMPCT